MSTLVERLMAARVRLKGLNISDCAAIRDAQDAMAEAANALTPTGSPDCGGDALARGQAKDWRGHP